MGTSGATGWESFFLGSNSGNVVTDIDIPMLCIPSQAPFRKIQTIGFTTRFRPKDKKALKRVLKIAHKTKAKVKCLYVKTNESDVSDATVKEWEAEFANEPITFSVVHSNEIKETILDFILQKDIDIITMLTYKRGFFESLFHTSLTKTATHEFSIPVLAIPIE